MTSRRKVAGGAILGAALLIAAFAMGRAVTPPSNAIPMDPDEQSPSARDERGAIEAATEFAQVMGSPTGDADAYLQAVSEIAAPEWQGRAQQLAENAVDFLKERYGDEGAIAFQPVRYRLRAFSPEEATIDIWGVVLGSNPDSSVIEESWVTATAKITWLGQEWKLSGQSSKGGPTPELLRADDGTEDTTLSGFQEYDGVASP